jgi:hypothetical protein
MHVYPGDFEEWWTQDDLVCVWNKQTNMVNVYRIKERFQEPTQERIDAYALDDDIPWCYFDDSRVFCVLEQLGMVRNTLEGILALVHSAN